MDARTYWNAYVDRHEGPAAVAQRLGIPYSTIAAVCNGSRGIGKKLAQRMADKDRDLDPKVLVLVLAESKN